ncbi:pentapeptide repeat-containing protein [Listeria sp. FSL L7-0233]|uniref:pentapeptide repeat-containing protein n=1 Tax=Listeria cossartiae TaxID=2838249 RepID=UPI001628D74A|nr:pentapeptide repeat-containing protein [Listeria cossartiae]MBC2182200.1 pentapeptide repeat-containing protein [Listeria cossartiae subsp. cossartiae]
MSRKLKKELRNRWYSELDFEINRSLKKENWRDKTTRNARWPQHPFGQTDSGKIDFRGFPFREPSKYHQLFNMDFSYSYSLHEITEGYGMSRGGSFSHSIMEGCLFIHAEMPANLSEKFTDCDFSNAVFVSTRINADFISCNFTNAKMKDVLVGAKFINCDFTKANLTKSALQMCHFENCIFEDTKFSRTNISGSTFVNTRPSDAQITKCSSADNLKIIKTDITKSNSLRG